MRINVKDARYTDVHDVDEDQMTISAQGGDWPYHENTGVLCRPMGDSPNYTSNAVASNSHISNSSTSTIQTKK